jgi:hypothetical protein
MEKGMPRKPSSFDITDTLVNERVRIEEKNKLMRGIKNTPKQKNKANTISITIQLTPHDIRLLHMMMEKEGSVSRSEQARMCIRERAVRMFTL